jgi:TonB family protein
MQDSYRLFRGLGPATPPASGSSILGSALIHGVVLAFLLSLGGQAVINAPARHRARLYIEIAPPPPERAVRATRPQAPAPKLTVAPQPAQARVEPPVRLYIPAKLARQQKPLAMPAPPQILAEAAPIGTDLNLAAPKPIPDPIKTGLFQAAAPVASANPKLTVETGNFPGATPTREGSTDHRIAEVATFGGVRTADRTAGRGRSVGNAGFRQALAAKPADAAQTAPVSAGFPAPVPAEMARPVRPPEEAPLSVAAILEKPRPAYTEEARNLKIEGEVLVEVLFSANGKAHVLRVIKGLGHGLDESATRAAEGIRFRPAVRGGAPVDSVAVAHVEFQLVY